MNDSKAACWRPSLLEAHADEVEAGDASAAPLDPDVGLEAEGLTAGQGFDELDLILEFLGSRHHSQQIASTPARPRPPRGAGLTLVFYLSIVNNAGHWENAPSGARFRGKLTPFPTFTTDPAPTALQVKVFPTVKESRWRRRKPDWNVERRETKLPHPTTVRLYP